MRSVRDGMRYQASGHSLPAQPTGQHSSGGKTVLPGTSKRGNAYLRTLYSQGARAVLRHSAKKSERFAYMDVGKGREQDAVALECGHKTG